VLDRYLSCAEASGDTTAAGVTGPSTVRSANDRGELLFVTRSERAWLRSGHSCGVGGSKVSQLRQSAGIAFRVRGLRWDRASVWDW
jgi:hypothetical protein